MSHLHNRDPRIFDFDPGDAPDVQIFRQKTRTARNGRRCDCGKWLLPGTKYTEVSGTEDGEFFCSVACVLLGPEYNCPSSAMLEPLSPEQANDS